MKKIETLAEQAAATIDERAENYYEHLTRPLPDAKGLAETAYTTGALDQQRIERYKATKGMRYFVFYYQINANRPGGVINGNGHTTIANEKMPSWKSVKRGVMKTLPYTEHELCITGFNEFDCEQDYIDFQS